MEKRYRVTAAELGRTEPRMLTAAQSRQFAKVTVALEWLANIGTPGRGGLIRITLVSLLASWALETQVSFGTCPQ